MLARGGVNGDSLFLLDPEGNFLSLRPALLSELGWSESDCLGRPLENFLYPQDRERVAANLALARTGETTAVFAARLVSGSGSDFRWDLLFVPRIQSQEVTGVFCLGEPSGGALPVPDLRASAPAEQRALLHLLEMLLANAPVGFCFFDERLAYVCVNHTLAAMNGYAPEQHLGRTMRELSPELALRVEPVLKRVLATGRAELNVELAFPGSPGSDVLCGSASFYPVFGSDGRPAGVGVIVLDITEQRRIEGILRESEDRFRLAIDAAQIGTWDWNLDTGRLTWSDRTKAMCGLPADASVDWARFMECLHPDDRPLVQRAVAKALEDPESVYGLEYRTIGRTDRVERFLSVRGKVYQDEAGKPRRFVGIAADVTEQKRAEETSRRLAAELQRSNDELRRFAAVASHDLQDPLRTVVSFLDLLIQRSREKMDEASRRYLELAASGARRMQLLIGDLLRYTRLDAQHPGTGRVDLNEVFRDTLLNLRTTLEETGARVEADPLPTVVGDASQFGQLLQNLIGNAVKYRRPDVRPEVHLSVHRQGTEWEFHLRDNGIGFAPAEADRIFESFHRLHGWDEYPGSGLGLATCRRIVERHGGRIWAKSEVGRGSVFFFTLPGS